MTQLGLSLGPGEEPDVQVCAPIPDAVDVGSRNVWQGLHVADDVSGQNPQLGCQLIA
ncbi:hypothetical protein [Streptomyces sp. NPDC051364]|uniref:hypothetical protein n=1 Tax=Streptomyces sp. NPDC051364 TaxID=3155799 RepID=UPI003414EBC2